MTLNESKLPSDTVFALGDKVRPENPMLDTKGRVWEVQVITPTQVRAVCGEAVLTLRKEKWIHA